MGGGILYLKDLVVFNYMLYWLEDIVVEMMFVKFVE